MARIFDGAEWRDETPDEAAAREAIVVPLDTLAAKLLREAQNACTAVTKAIAVTETHLAGYQSAANMVQAAQGVPAADPAKTAFANLAAAIGIEPAQLASLVLAMDAASVGNLVVLTALTSAAAASKTPAELATALAAFQTALAAEIAALNAAGLTTQIPAPTPITIAGING